MSYDTQAVKYIVFDLDGTLINTKPDVMIALNKTLAYFGQPHLPRFEVYSCIGKGLKYMLRTAFKKFNSNLIGEHMEIAKQYYLDYYMRHPVVETTIYPEVENVLTQLQQEGMQFGICTNKPGMTARMVLDKLNLTRFFTAISCGDEFKYPKPDGRHVLDVVTAMHADISQTVFVGDSLVDKQAAENAGIPFIGATYGYDLNEFTLGLVIPQFLDLPAALQTLTRQEKIA
jgi:phosphoglycolate phosphatase